MQWPAALNLLACQYSPQRCCYRYAAHCTPLLHYNCLSKLALPQPWSAFGDIAFQSDLTLCLQLLGRVTSPATALSITCVWFKLSTHTWRVVKYKTRFCYMLHLQTTIAISSPAAELVLVCRIIAESTSSLYCCLFSSSRRGFVVCVWQLRCRLGTVRRYAVHHLSLHVIISPRVANR